MTQRYLLGACLLRALVFLAAAAVSVDDTSSTELTQSSLGADLGVLGIEVPDDLGVGGPDDLGVPTQLGGSSDLGGRIELWGLAP